MTKFKKGNIPWNKDKKGIHLSIKSEFKKGQRSGDKNNTWKGGVQTMTHDCVHIYEGVGKSIRRPKKVYEEYYGYPIPDGFVIYHLDRDKHNDDISNLEVISRKELLKRNRNKNESGTS